MKPTGGDRAASLRAVFFDAGNTLLYPRLDNVARVLREAGFPAAPGDFQAAERQAKQKLDDWLWPQIRRHEVPPTVDRYYWNQYLEAVLARLATPPAAHARLTELLIREFSNIRTWSVVLPETPAYLASLKKRGYFLGVISNSSGTIENQLSHVGLRPLFATVLDSAIVGVEKPHPEIFQLALARAQAEPREAVFVGDTHATDVGGAQLAGLMGVLIDRVGAYPAAPCPRITSLPELDRVLGNRGRTGP